MTTTEPVYRNRLIESRHGFAIKQVGFGEMQNKYYATASGYYLHRDGTLQRTTGSSDEYPGYFESLEAVHLAIELNRRSIP